MEPKKKYEKELSGLTTVQQELYLEQVRKFELLKVAVPTGLIRERILNDTQNNMDLKDEHGMFIQTIEDFEIELRTTEWWRFKRMIWLNKQIAYYEGLLNTLYNVK